MAFSFIITDNGVTINMTMLQELVQDNTAAVKPFIELFLANVPAEVDALLLLHHNNDWENLAKTAKADQTDHLKPRQVDHLYCWRRFSVQLC